MKDYADDLRNSANLHEIAMDVTQRPRSRAELMTMMVMTTLATLTPNAASALFIESSGFDRKRLEFRISHVCLVWPDEL